MPVSGKSALKSCVCVDYEDYIHLKCRHTLVAAPPVVVQ